MTRVYPDLAVAPEKAFHGSKHLLTRDLDEMSYLTLTILMHFPEMIVH